MPSSSVGFFQADVAATENSDLAPIFWMATVWVSLLYSAKPLASSQRSLLYLVSFVLWVLMNIFSERFLEPEKSLTRWVQYILLNVHFQFCGRCTISNAERFFSVGLCTRPRSSSSTGSSRSTRSVPRCGSSKKSLITHLTSRGRFAPTKGRRHASSTNVCVAKQGMPWPQCYQTWSSDQSCQISSMSSRQSLCYLEGVSCRKSKV